MNNVSREDIETIAKEILYYDNYKIEDNGHLITFIETVPSSKKSIYIMKDKFNRVKIGVSEHPKSRKHQLSTTTTLDIDVKYYTELCSNSFQIERKMHNIFKDYNIGGEWFDINENEAIEMLKKQTLEYIDFDITDKKVTYSYKEIKNILLVYNYIDIEQLEANDRFLLNATKEEFLEVIKKLFISDNEHNMFNGIARIKYVNLQQYLYVYFNIFNETKISIFNIEIEYKPKNNVIFMVSDDCLYDDIETYIDLTRTGVYSFLKY